MIAVMKNNDISIEILITFYMYMAYMKFCYRYRTYRCVVSYVPLNIGTIFQTLIQPSR